MKTLLHERRGPRNSLRLQTNVRRIKLLKSTIGCIKMQPYGISNVPVLPRTTTHSVFARDSVLLLFHCVYGACHGDVESDIPANAPAVKASSKTHSIAMAG